MPDPQSYERDYSFSDFQANNPSSPLPAPALDNELENIEAAISGTVDAIKDVRRADGALPNEKVTLDSLAPEVRDQIGEGALDARDAAIEASEASADSAAAAASSAGAAAGSAGTAATSAGQAMTFRNAAQTAQTQAETARDGAATARDFASQWASAPSSTLVDDGLNTPDYSAYHYAQVALGAATGALPDNSVGTSVLQDGAVTDVKLADEAVTEPKLNSALSSKLPRIVDTVADLAALDPARVSVAQVLEDGKEGIFDRRLLAALSATRQASVAADTLQGIYVPSSIDASYVWVRRRPNGQIYDVRWFGVVSDDSGAAAANSAALAVINSMVEFRKGTILLPYGLVHIASTFTTDKIISWQGVDKAASGLYAVDFVSDQSILDYDGLTNGLGIANMSMRNCSLWSSNNLARAGTMRGVIKSTFEDLYFYEVRRGFFGEEMWSNNFKNVSAFGVTDEMFYLDDECNNIHFDRVEFRGNTGIRVVGNCAGLTFTQCDIEGIEGGSSPTGMEFAPAAGKRVRGVSIVGNYFEKIEDVGIRFAGVDADSVQGVVIKGCSFFAGSAAYYSSDPSKARFGIVLSNLAGFDISDNSFFDWSGAAFFSTGTEVNGTVENNILENVPALTTSGDVFNSPTVEDWNNTYGKSKEFRTSAPTSGTYRTGSMVHNLTPTLDANNMVLTGWIRSGTGSGHVVGTDWLRMYASHGSPAT